MGKLEDGSVGAACIHPAAPCLSSLVKGETAIASQPFVSKASLDGMEVTATAIACGQEFLHEFWVSVSSRAPVGCDKTLTAAQWYERCWMKALCLPSYQCSSELKKMPAGLDHRPITNMEGQRRPLGLCPCLQPTPLPVMLDILCSVAL